MKNKTLLLVSLLFIVLLSTVVFAQERAAPASDAFASKIGGYFEKLLNAVGNILGSLFTAVSKSPFVWLRFLFFIVIFAVLHYSTKQIKLFDDKTSAIVSFVIAFATVAITPAALLVGVVSIYGGLILLGLIAVPLYFLVHMTNTVRKNNVNLFFLILAWIVFGALVATINTTTDTITIKGPLVVGPTIKGPLLTDATYKSLLSIVETSLDLIVMGSILTALVLFFWWLFSIGTGTGAAPPPALAPGAGTTGGGWLGEALRPFKTSFKKLWTPTLASELEAVENIRAELHAASRHKSDFKDYLKKTLQEINTISKSTSDIKNRIVELVSYKDQLDLSDRGSVDEMNSFAKSMSNDLKGIKKDLSDASNEATYDDALTSINSAKDKLNDFEINLKALTGLEKKLEAKISQ